MKKAPLMVLPISLVPTKTLSACCGIGMPDIELGFEFYLIVALVVLMYCAIIVALNYFLYRKFNKKLENNHLNDAKAIGFLLIVINLIAFFFTFRVAAIVSGSFLYRKYKQKTQANIKII